MSVLKGEVKLRVDVSGDGTSGQRAVSGLTSEMDRSTKAGNLLSDSAGKIKAKVDDLKGSVGGVNRLREGFENLRSNVGFVVGSFTALGGVAIAVVGEIIDFVSGADRAAAAVKRWDAHQRDFNNALKTGWELLDKTSQSPIEEALSDVNVQLARASVLLVDIKEDEEEWLKKSKEVEALHRLQSALQADIARDAERSADAWARIKKSMEEASALDVPIISPFTGNSNDPALKVTRNEFGEIETDAQRAERKKRLEDAIRRNRNKGGGSKRGDPNAVFRYASPEGSLIGLDQMSPNDKAALFPDVFGGLNLDVLPGSGGGGSARGDKLSQQAASFDVLSEAVSHFADTVSPVVDDLLPGLGETISGVDQAMDALANTTDRSAKALVAAASTGARATLGGIGQIMGGKRGLFIGEALGEEAAALASFVAGDLAGFAGHQAVAAAYGVAAAAMGGGGGGGGRRGSVSSPRSTRVSTATQIGGGAPYFQINAPWFGGLQEGGAYVYGVAQRAAGTGWAA